MEEANPGGIRWEEEHGLEFQLESPSLLCFGLILSYDYDDDASGD